MNPPRFLLIAGICLTLSAAAARAQSPAQKPKATPAGDPAAAKSEADLAREGRQAQARALLFTLSGEARGFRDQTLRARSLARIADALWATAPEQARTLLREAWEAAEKADQEGHQELNLRRSILALAAKRDPQLADELLQRLTAAKEEAKVTPASVSPPANNWELSEPLEQRLNLAEDLLSAGDISGALRFADPALGSVTISTLEFLTRLRALDAGAADRRYANMLANTAGNPLADANTVSLLSSYIFTPRLYVVFNRAGGADTSTMLPLPPRAEVAPQLRLAFFQTARGVLLRPQPPPEQDRTTSGLAGKYMAIKRLLPLFEQYAPPGVAAAVRGHFEALHAQVSDAARQGDEEWTRKGIVPEKPPDEREGSLLADIERARTADERDQLYFKLALQALERDEETARDYAGKIEETSFRQRALAWIAWSMAVRGVKQKKVEQALGLARGGELTPVQKVLVLTRAAKRLAEADRDRASAVLADALAEARRLERDDADRPRALLAVAGALRLVEPSSAWDALADAVEAANAAEGFTGEDGALTVTIYSPSQILKRSEPAPEFNVAGVFAEMAKTDFDRAVQAARGFKTEAPRVGAIIAVARAVLSEEAVPAVRPSAVPRAASTAP